MQFRIPVARSVGLLTALVVLAGGILSYQQELQGAETRSPGPEAAQPLAASLGVRFVEGSASSVILERDGKEYVVDLAARTVREIDPLLEVASAETQQAPPADPGAAIFQQQCASCHGADGKGAANSGTPDLTDFRARSGIPGDSIVGVITNGRGTSMQAFAGKLSAAQIRDVAAFVQSLPTQAERTDLYEAPDDFVYSLPTGRPVARGGL
jgi:mono/diheme cytochrome c family protein